MATNEKRKGGPKRTRSETVTVRLEPKVRYLAELAGSKMRRTLSSYIEWAIEDSFKSVWLYNGTSYGGDGARSADEPLSVADMEDELWDIHEGERFARLGIRYPELFTAEQQELWKFICDCQLLSPARSRSDSGAVLWSHPILEDYVYPKVRELWTELLSAYRGGSEAQANFIKLTRQRVASGETYPGFKWPSKAVPKRTGTEEELDAKDL